jgi:hypothetical protein
MEEKPPERMLGKKRMTLPHKPQIYVTKNMHLFSLTNTKKDEKEKLLSK